MATLHRLLAARAGIHRSIALAGILLLAVVTRAVGIDHRLVHDEGYTWLVGSAPSVGSFLQRLAAFENTPPLYYLLLAPLPLGDEPWVRLPSLVAGVAIVPVLYMVIRPALGTRVALLSALALAVAPYAVANSNLARGFMLADLALLVALWGAIRAHDRGSTRWWLVYWTGAVAAIYSEYDSATTLVGLGIGMVAIAPGHRRRTLLLAALPAVALVPWIHELSRSLGALHATKVGGGYLTVTPASIRDQLVPLFYGETGQGAPAVVRTLALLGLLAVVAYGLRAMWLRRRDARALFVLLACAGAGTLVLHMLGPAVGVGIFDVRYLTFLIPLACVVLAQAVAVVPMRGLVPIAAGVLSLAGIGLAIKRLHRETEPDPHAISELVRADKARTILTNSAAIAYYFRADHAILDRPLNFGRDLETGCPTCPRPIAVVDDTQVGSGPRPGPGPAVRVGHFVVRLVQ